MQVSKTLISYEPNFQEQIKTSEKALESQKKDFDKAKSQFNMVDHRRGFYEMNLAHRRSTWTGRLANWIRSCLPNSILSKIGSIGQEALEQNYIESNLQSDKSRLPFLSTQKENAKLRFDGAEIRFQGAKNALTAFQENIKKVEKLFKNTRRFEALPECNSSIYDFDFSKILSFELSHSVMRQVTKSGSIIILMKNEKDYMPVIACPVSIIDDLMNEMGSKRKTMEDMVNHINQSIDKNIAFQVFGDDFSNTQRNRKI